VVDLDDVGPGFADDDNDDDDDDEIVLDLARVAVFPFVDGDGFVGRLLEGVRGRDMELGFDVWTEEELAAAGARDERRSGPPAGELL
jgi:hypothetical protein